MGGKVLLLILVLAVKNGYKDHVDAEIVARKMQTEMKEFINEYGEDSNLDDIGFTRTRIFSSYAKRSKMSKRTMLCPLMTHLKRLVRSSHSPTW